MERKRLETEALAEWQCFVEDTMNGLFDSILANPALIQKLQHADKNWDALKQADRIEILMHVSELTAQAFEVDVPRFFTKNSWQVHKKEYGYDDDYFDKRANFGFYIIDQDWKNPGIVMNWTTEYTIVKGLVGVSSVMIHEFGHYLHDLYVRKIKTLEQLGNIPLLSQNIPSSKAIERLAVFLPYSIEYFEEEAKDNPRAPYEKLWDDESITDYEEAVASFKYLEIFGEQVAEIPAEIFSAQLRALLWWTENKSRAERIARVPELFAEIKQAMDASADECGFGMSSHDLVPRYKGSIDFRSDAERVKELCEAISKEFTEKFLSCDPQAMKHHTHETISPLFSPDGKMHALIAYIAMLLRADKKH